MGTLKIFFIKNEMRKDALIIHMQTNALTETNIISFIVIYFMIDFLLYK